MPSPKDRKTAAFIKKQRTAGVTDTATAIQFETSRRGFAREIDRLEALGLDCGKPRTPGHPRKELKLPETPAK